MLGYYESITHLREGKYQNPTHSSLPCGRRKIPSSVHLGHPIPGKGKRKNWATLLKSEFTVHRFAKILKLNHRTTQCFPIPYHHITKGLFKQCLLPITPCTAIKKNYKHTKRRKEKNTHNLKRQSKHRWPLSLTHAEDCCAPHTSASMLLKLITPWLSLS